MSIILITILVTSFVSVNDEAIKLDGKISKGEWIGAQEYNLSSGGKLHILRKDETLYLGIAGNSPGWAHIYLNWKDSVKVLHASAALGDQLYTNEKGDWKLQKKFAWELREFEYSENLVQKQAAYYTKNGWCANNNNTGDKITLEYKIDLRSFGNAEVRFAALFTSDAKKLSYYPTDLNDNTLLEKLVSGSDPDHLHFKPNTWTTIK
ncbi:MAG TPA: hypothetical protein VMZ03_08540 [Chitinophagaceae bacterium]|nr:hypothetical protein [Chitinophagaceae bacterium]